jgi:acetylornithine deacetylase
MESRAEIKRQRGIERHLSHIADSLEARLAETIADLVRIPSENTPPVGAEYDCQRHIRDRLARLGLEAETYELASVPNLVSHAVYRKGRDYTRRPNVAAAWRGSGGGRSLLLSGHVDTVPRGSEPWRRDPFGGQRDGNRVYGLGANDMKGGIAAMILTVEVLKEAGVRLRGDLLLETVVDEEFGGVNGTLAARLRGHNAQAAIMCEPSQNVICPAQMGGRTVHITLRGSGEGILYEGGSRAHPADQIHHVLGKLADFARQRRQNTPVHPLYQESKDPVPVWVTKISCGGWGTREPITVPPACRLEIYWQAMPGEEQQNIDSEFQRWWKSTVDERADLFPANPEIQFPIEWLPGSAIDAQHELVTGLSSAYRDTTGASALVQGIGGPCDMFVFHEHFGIPAVLFGPKGGNTHAPDEWVDLASAVTTVETLARFICRWCGTDDWA